MTLTDLTAATSTTGIGISGLGTTELHVMTAAMPLTELMEMAAAMRDQGHGNVVTYSRKVFIPLTQLCADVCHYCTFAKTPRHLVRAYLTRDEVLKIAQAGAAAGCREALFTLGDKPENRYRVARDELCAMGYASTVDYLAAMCRAVFEETGLLPHVNPGVLDAGQIRLLRQVSISQGIMLESSSERLRLKGMPHYGSPDKAPAVRMETIMEAGRQSVPFTSGILIGIGETREERLHTLLALKTAADAHGHLQEVIVQNFRAKPNTRMADAPEPDIEDHLWTIAMARIILGPRANIQAPPNLMPGRTAELVAAGINDFGGISPVTIDHVNPEAPWPQIAELSQEVDRCGKDLVERLAVYPEYVEDMKRWTDPVFHPVLIRGTDLTGYPRTNTWAAGASDGPPADDIAIMRRPALLAGHSQIRATLDRAFDGARLSEAEIERLFRARGREFAAICQAADALRCVEVDDTVTYAVNRNINYTNVCTYRCTFCAFSKGSVDEHLRGRPYDLDLAEIRRRVCEAWDRGATEVCLQGGIHPDYTGDTYLSICRTIKGACPQMHIHAFSPLEIWQGAHTLGLSLEAFLTELRQAGLSSLPGTAAEILHDEVREILCPDKIHTAQWLEVIETAHRVGLRTTATIMYGHIERPRHWAAHLLAIRDLQERTGGFTEFVPLPFVSLEAPARLRAIARPGPTFREAVLMHAVARLALSPLIRNIQTSWVKMGCTGAQLCLEAGCNDLGGSLMNESITRAAGAVHGQEFAPAEIRQTILKMRRRPVHRTTLYQHVDAARTAIAEAAAPLTDVINAPAGKFARIGSAAARRARVDSRLQNETRE